jgi:hypothetical protein
VALLGELHSVTLQLPIPKLRSWVKQVRTYEYLCTYLIDTDSPQSTVKFECSRQTLYPRLPTGMPTHSPRDDTRPCSHSDLKSSASLYGQSRSTRNHPQISQAQCLIRTSLLPVHPPWCLHMTRFYIFCPQTKPNHLSMYSRTWLNSHSGHFPNGWGCATFFCLTICKITSIPSAFNARSQKFTKLLQFPTHVAKDNAMSAAQFFHILKTCNSDYKNSFFPWLEFFLFWTGEIILASYLKFRFDKVGFLS